MMSDLYAGMWVKCADKMPEVGVPVIVRTAADEMLESLYKEGRWWWRSLFGQDNWRPHREQTAVVEWLDSTPQTSELDRLDALCSTSDRFEWHYQSSPICVWIYVDGTSKKFDGDNAFDRAIAHLESQRVPTFEQAAEAWLRSRTPAVDVVDILNRYFEKGDADADNDTV